MNQLACQECDESVFIRRESLVFEPIEFHTMMYNIALLGKARLPLDSSILEGLRRVQAPNDLCLTEKSEIYLISLEPEPQRTEVYGFEESADSKTIFTTFLNREDDHEEHLDEHPSEVHEVLEQMVTGEDAIRLHRMLTNPPSNPRKDRRIAKALREFPDPDKPTVLDIDL